MSEPQTAAPPAPPESPPETACDECAPVSGRGVILAVAFAAFAAYVAADFATGGRVSAFILALLPKRAPAEATP